MQSRPSTQDAMMVEFKRYKEWQIEDRGTWPQPLPCVTQNTKLWFSNKREHENEASRHCLTSCPVTEKCLAFALLRNPEAGVYGGMTEAERKTLERRSRRFFFRKSWDAATTKSFQSWVRKTVQDKQKETTGVVRR